MSNEPNSQEQVISLQAISQNFLGALQRQFDLLAYNLASAQQVDAEHYESFARQVKLMPVGQLHQNFEQVQAYSRGLIFRQTLNDLLNLSAACMDNCYLLCQLISNQETAKTAGAEAANKNVSTKMEAFTRAPLNEKFEHFEKDFDIMSETEDAIIAIAVGLRVLMARNGSITAEDVNEDGELVFEFKTVQTISPPRGVENQQAEVRVVDTRRAFRAGDHLELSNSELLGLGITVASFFHGLFRAVDAFGQKTLGPAAKGQSPASQN